MGAARDQPFPQESRASTLRLEEICSTILRPPASQGCAPHRRQEAQIWAVAKPFRRAPHSRHMCRARLPADPSSFIASPPDGTNAAAQKINLSHLDDNTLPQVIMLHHFEKGRQGQLYISISTGETLL